MLRSALLILLIICVICALPAYAGVKWDFEDGTLQGWTVVSGDAGPQPVDKSDDRYGGNFNKEGKYFIGTYENVKDDAEVEYLSPEFVISADTMTLLIGGGSLPDRTYVALYVDGEEVYRETGANSEQMQRRYWDVSAYRGRTAHVRIVDRERGGWGHVNVDDIRELTPAEQARIEAEKVRREADGRRWMESLMKSDGRKVYAGAELKDLAMPLGGIGAGNIAVCGDGALREWQIFNKVNAGCVVPGGFFAIWAKLADRAPVARLLQTAPVADLPTVGATDFIGEFPIAEVIYRDDDLPVSVRMEAFSPFIPMNAKDSGIPGIVFSFRVRNPGSRAVSVSLVASLQNAVNYDGRTQIDGVWFEGYGGNFNEVFVGKDYTAVSMKNPSLSPDDRQFGTMTLAALSDAATANPQWDSYEILWNDFSDDGRIYSIGAPRPSRTGRTWNGSIAVPLELKPRQEGTVSFVVTWHFPNFYADYQDNLAKYRIGRNYANVFGDSDAVSLYIADNISRLSRETRLFRDKFFDSTLPYWFVQRVGAPVSTLTSQTMLWIEDGSFHGFEGSGDHGCCPMNCTHVYNYEMALAHLFPELERNMRDTDLNVQQMPSGAVHHRTVLPLSLPRASGTFVDGQLGTILKSYREYRLSADRAWFDGMWPKIKLAMDFVIREWDPNGDGVLVNEQWNTYDAAMYGPNTFIGTMYLAALRASEEMARVADDEAESARYRSIFESGSERLDSVLWNGEYYVHIDERREAEALESAHWIVEDWPQKEDAGANRPYGAGCHADQLLGQWWAHLLDLGYLLPGERVRASLDSIMRYNWRWDFAEVPQQRVFALKGDKGLLNCTWPKGGRPPQMTLYSDEAWTGIEYEVAGLMLYEGKINDASMVARAVHDRYNGVPNPPFRRNPWNEIECGQHYARAMSSWSMLTAAQGFAYCGPDGSIGFDPRLQPENHRSFFAVAEGWGTFEQKRTSTSQVNTLSLAYGALNLRTVSLRVPEGMRPPSVSAGVRRRAMTPIVERDGSRLTLRFTEPLELRAGDKLSIKVDW